VGSLIGSRLTGVIAPDTLRKGFGWFVIAMGVLILVQQVPAEVSEQAWFWPVVSGAAVLGLLGGGAAWMRSRRAHPVVEQPTPDEELLCLDGQGDDQR
jgi:uncharacterized membrane protein YfcA